MYKLNIKDMLYLLLIVVAFAGLMIGLAYLGVDLGAPINVPSGSTPPSHSPTGAMSGTIG